MVEGTLAEVVGAGEDGDIGLQQNPAFGWLPKEWSSGVRALYAYGKTGGLSSVIMSVHT